jgi:hypothetical protein
VVDELNDTEERMERKKREGKKRTRIPFGSSNLFSCNSNSSSTYSTIFSVNFGFPSPSSPSICGSSRAAIASLFHFSLISGSFLFTHQSGLLRIAYERASMSISCCE